MLPSPYRCEAVSVEGFVQQLAVSYVSKGYYFYVTGHLPEGKDANAVDAKIIAQYGIAMSKFTRCRRKREGWASVQYLRLDRTFVILATHGKHEFLEAEHKEVKDCRKYPITLFGYAVSNVKGHACVRLSEREFIAQRARLVELALHRTPDAVAAAFRSLPFQPYKPIRRQLMQIWRECNRVRKARGFDRVEIDCIPMLRQIVKPFHCDDGRPRQRAADLRREQVRCGASENGLTSIEIAAHPPAAPVSGMLPGGRESGMGGHTWQDLEHQPGKGSILLDQK